MPNQKALKADTAGEMNNMCISYFSNLNAVMFGQCTANLP